MTALKGHHDWEPVAHNADLIDVVERMQVPGGWIYRTVITDNTADDLRLAMVFVPKPIIEGAAFP